MITCLVTVIVMNMPGATKLQGRVILNSTHYYLADFSEDAKAKGMGGDFKARIVEKTKCE